MNRKLGKKSYPPVEVSLEKKLLFDLHWKLSRGLQLLRRTFIGVQSLISSRQHLFRALSHFIILPARRKTHRNLLPLPVEFKRTKPVQHKFELFQRALRKHYQKLIAAQAHRQIRSPDYLVQAR